jgi:hypothetical protein
MGWGMIFQIFSIVGEVGQVVRFNIVQSVSQGHVSKAVMVAVRLPIGSDMDKLGLFLIPGEDAKQPR